VRAGELRDTAAIAFIAPSLLLRPAFFYITFFRITFFLHHVYFVPRFCSTNSIVTPRTTLYRFCTFAILVALERDYVAFEPNWSPARSVEIGLRCQFARNWSGCFVLIHSLFEGFPMSAEASVDVCYA
jgi:hypothetical protein